MLCCGHCAPTMFVWRNTVLQMREEHTTAQEIEAWKAPCTCLPGQVAPGAQLVCTCGSDKTYSGAIADYEHAISRDQIKNSVSQAGNPAGIKARTSDLKFKSTEMLQDFLAAYSCSDRQALFSQTVALLRIEGGGSILHRPERIGPRCACLPSFVTTV